MKGIIFGAESVKAILAGNKTQSRRIMKPQPTRIGDPYNLWIHEQGMKVTANDPRMAGFARYKAGETVYVKESYYQSHDGKIYYKAGGALNLDYRTPLFMPESISRIKLRIVRVGCERLHDISLEDIQKEGVVLNRKQWGTDQWQSRWIEVNGRPSWDSNPWVWVYEFERVS